MVGSPEGKRPLGRPSHRWEDNIKMDLQDVGQGGLDPFTTFTLIKFFPHNFFINHLNNEGHFTGEVKCVLYK
jgi:hypothetical protein